MLPISVPEPGRVMNSDLGFRQTVASVSPAHTCLDTALTSSFAIHLRKVVHFPLKSHALQDLWTLNGYLLGEPTKPKT